MCMYVYVPLQTAPHPCLAWALQSGHLITMYIYLYMYISIYVYTYIYMYIDICIDIYIDIHILMRIQDIETPDQTYQTEIGVEDRSAPH